MINAWSLAAEVLEGTLDETYPIMKKARKLELLFLETLNKHYTQKVVSS